MSEPLDPSATPLATVDPDSVTALFDADPNGLDDAAFLRLIGEMRRRADAKRAELAAAEAAPKATRKKRGGPSALADAAVAALRDKPLSELSAADLFAPNLGGTEGEP